MESHPFFASTDPSKSTLVRISDPAPAWLNPFAGNGVEIRAAIIPGEVEHSKSYMARELILGAIRDGAVSMDTVVIEASSGNTGHGIAKFCKTLGLACQLILPASTSPGKIEAISVMGSGVDVIVHRDPDESTVDVARRRGRAPGYHHLDQYSAWRNPWAHKTYLAPQLFKKAGEPALISVASGTMGTSMGLKQYADENDLSTRVLAVLVEEGDDVPGARPLSRISKDVRLPWSDCLGPNDIEFGSRTGALALARYTWSWLPQMLGPSFGLAMQGALRRLNDYKVAGTLDGLRRDGVISVIVVGADTYLPYLDLFQELDGSLRRNGSREPDILTTAMNCSSAA